MRLLLDTTFLIEVIRGQERAKKALVWAVNSGHELGMSALNLAEIYSGMRDHEERVAQEFLATLTCYPVSNSIAERGGRLRNAYARRGITLGLADAVIAATALEHGLALVTDNRKDFPMPELSFYPSA